MLVRCLKTAAGRLSFSAGDVVDLDVEDVKSLEEAGAVQRVKEDEPSTDSEPNQSADQPSRRSQASRAR